MEETETIELPDSLLHNQIYIQQLDVIFWDPTLKDI